MGRGEFALRFRAPFADPAFETEGAAISRLEEIAWKAYSEGRKAPVTRIAGPGYADPEYELSVEWIEAKERIARAQAQWSDPHTASRVLVAGIESAQHALSDWLDWMDLVKAGAQARLERYIGYYEPYATSHESLDHDEALQVEARNVGRLVAHAVGEMRAGRLQASQPRLPRPRPK